MKIATWNVNGIRARQAQTLEWIQEEAPDVVCLQEIKASPEQVPAGLCSLDGYWGCWHGAGGYSGVALLVRKEICPEQPVFSHPSFDAQTRIVTAVIGGVTIASIYVPNGGKDFVAKLRFFNALTAYAADFEASGDPLILCGDLNIARAEIDVHPKERRSVIGQLPQERELFEQLLGHGLVDLARALHPAEEGVYTWWAPWREMRQRNIGWRLDYVVASGGIAQSAQSCEVRRSIGTSDHAPVVALL